MQRFIFISPSHPFGHWAARVLSAACLPVPLSTTGANTRALMKIVVDMETDKVVGMHMCGPEAAEIMQGFSVALKMGATKADLDSTIGIHPSSAEEFVTMRSPSHYLVDGVKVDKLP